MTSKELTYLLNTPSEIKKKDTDMLEKLSKEFPYFQPIRVLLLKGLKDQESFRYNQELKITAAYTTDRSILFDFITSPVFDKNAAQFTQEQKSKNDIEVIGAEEINVLERMSMEDAITMKIKEAEDVLNPGLFHTKEKNDTPRNITIAKTIIGQAEKKHPKILKATHINNDPEATLQIDKPLDFNKKEKHSFKEWLQLSKIQPIDRNIEKEKSAPPLNESKKEEKQSPSEKEQKFDLISKFIRENPKIKPADKSTPARNLAKEHSVTPDELMTETLARVYLAQKKYKNAIQAYKILILKNPEKSGFFADQIRAIKKLQENKY